MKNRTTTTTKNPDQLWLTFYTPGPQPNGDVLLKQQTIRPSNKVTVKQAARIMGISDDGVRRLIDCGALAIERPTPHKTLVLVESLEAHRQRTRTAEIWQDDAGVSTFAGLAAA
jgi:hypothetical protein